MNYQYILDGNQPVPCDDLMQWEQWMETANRHLAQDQIDEVRVSTVFLGSDHNDLGDGPPILWETMIFGGAHHEYQERYTTRDEALSGHQQACLLVRQEEDTP